MTSVLLGLFPLFGWGAGDYISSKLSKNFHPVFINLAFSLSGPLVSLPVCFVLGFPEFSVKSTALFWIVSVAITTGFIFMVRAFSRGATGVVSPIANSYVIITALLSVLFLGDQLRLTGVLAIFLVVVGIAGLTYKKDPDHNKADFRFGVTNACIALLAFGVGFVLFDVASTQEWYQNNFYFQLVGATNAVILFLFWPIRGKKKMAIRSLRNPLIYLGGAVGTIGTIGFFSALSFAESVAIPAALAAASPLATVTFAHYIDHEHLTTTQRMSTMVIIGGIILLAL